MKRLVLLLCPLLVPVAATSHHAAVEYTDGDLVEVTGILKRIMWR